MDRQLRILWYLPVSLLASGCKHPPTLVGQWKGTILQVESTVEFKDDKSVSIDMKQSGMGATLTGTYEATPKNLNFTIIDYKLSSVPVTLTPLATSMFDPIKGKAFKTTYQFNNEDEIAVTYNSKTDILKRVAADQ